MRSDDKALHLHPLAVFVFLKRFFGQNFIYLVVLYFSLLNNLKSSIVFQISFIFLPLLILLSAFLSYFCFSYKIDENSITINSGIFFKKHQHIPYQKIQTIEHRQWFFLKPLKLEHLIFDTAGRSKDDKKSELFLISSDQAEIIDNLKNGQKALLGKSDIKDSELSVYSEDEFHLNKKDLNLFSILSAKILTTVFGLAALCEFFSPILPGSFRNGSIFWFNRLSFVNKLFIYTALFLGLYLFSYLHQLLSFYMFTVVKKNGRINISKGFFQRKVTSQPLARIQAVNIEEPILYRFFGFSKVSTFTASDVKRSEEDDEKILTIFPLIRKDILFEHLISLIDWVPKQSLPLNKPKPSGRYYFIRNAFFIWSTVFIFAVYFWHFSGLLILPVLFLAIWNADFYGRQTAWLVDRKKDIVVIGSSRLFAKEYYLLPFKAVQSVQVKQSIWMKNKNRAHLIMNIRKGNGSFKVQLRYIQKESADQIYNLYLARFFNK